MSIKNLTKEQEARFDKLNLIHPKKMKSHEKYEFNLLLGKKYLYLSTRAKYTQNQKKFYIIIQYHIQYCSVLL